MVSEMRVPSSSNSSSRHHVSETLVFQGFQPHRFVRTDCDWFDPHTLLQVRICGIVSILALQDLPATQCVDEGSPA